MSTFWGLLLVTILELIATDPWQELQPLPDQEGFAGALAGISHGALIVAGGANFPAKPPWEGGQKTWYDQVWVLDSLEGQWRAVGRLPRPLGYGVSVTYEDGIICVGGSDGQRSCSEVFRLEWKQDQLVTTPLATLPKPLSNHCGAIVGDELYVAGGQSESDGAKASRSFFRLDLRSSRSSWQTLEDCPGDGRILAVAAGLDGAFWYIGGVDMIVDEAGTAKRRYLTSAYRYDERVGWKRIADLPRAAAAAPSPAPTSQSAIFVLGGDDGTQIGFDPKLHRGFSRTILRYDWNMDRWMEAGEVIAPRVTVPCVPWEQRWIIPSGEVRPGVRSPKVMAWKPSSVE